MCCTAAADDLRFRSAEGHTPLFFSPSLLLSLSLSLLHLHTEPRPRLMLSFRCWADRGPIISCFHGSYNSASWEAILQPLVFRLILCVGQRRLRSFPLASELTGLLKHHNSAAPSLEARRTCTAMQQLIDNHCLPLKVKHAPPDDRRPLGCRQFFLALEFHEFYLNGIL